MKDTSVRRNQIQNALGPAIEKALAGIPGLDLSKPEHQRRYVRALARIASQELMHRGVGPGDILAACIEGIGREVEASGLLPEVNLLVEDTSAPPKFLN